MAKSGFTMDSFTNKIFHNKIFDKDKMKDFGFKCDGTKLIFNKKILEDQSNLTITVEDLKNISTKLYDCFSNELYTLHIVDSAQGKFVGKVRKAYEHVLTSIAENCCNNTYFHFPQSNRITALIKEKYNDLPEFLWEKFAGYAVFRNPESEKWYGLIANVDRTKLDKKSKVEVEILNIKLDKDKIPELLKSEGFYSAYHMNKKSWITIILDETVSDKQIMELIEQSHEFSQGKKKSKNIKNEWIIPANPKYFDLDRAFSENQEIIWKQSSNIKVNDNVYLYVAAPVSAICYKCTVTEVNIPYNYEDKNLKINKVMKIKLEKKYDKDFLPFKILNEYGINAVRGPRNITQALSTVLNQKG